MPDLSVPVSEQDHVQGPEDAPLTLVEYGDFQCPSCGEAYPIVKAVQKHFGDRLCFAFRHYPLPQHAMAEPAAEAAEAAAAHDKFWEMHDALYENQADLSTDLIASLAGDLQLNETAMEKAMEQHKFGKHIEADISSGDQSGVEGTPTFYINGKQHEGAFSQQALIRALEAAGKS